MIVIFEYVGSAFILAATGLRAFPTRIMLSFICSIIGSVILAIYSLGTHQYGFLVLNSASIFMASFGIYKWLKVKVVETIKRKKVQPYVDRIKPR